MTNIESISEMSEKVTGCNFKSCSETGQCAAVAVAINGLDSDIFQTNAAQLIRSLTPFTNINCPNAEEIIGKLK